MGNSLNESLAKRVVFFKQDSLSVKAPEHPFLVTGGFGAQPHTHGTALMGTFLSDGESARMDGWNVERAATDEEVRDFARGNAIAQSVLMAEGLVVIDDEPTPTKEEAVPGNDTLDIRNGLQSLVERAPAGGLFHHAEMEATSRNAFSLRLAEGGPIYTVTVTYGGSLITRQGAS